MKKKNLKQRKNRVGNLEVLVNFISLQTSSSGLTSDKYKSLDWLEEFKTQRSFWESD